MHSIASTVGQFVGALFATGLLSRLFLWLFSGWDGGKRRIVLAHVMSLLTCGFLGGLGFANTGAFAGLYA
jgi:hypothetical protein